MTRVKALTAVASAAALALALSACTDGSDTNPSDPTSSSGEPTTSQTAAFEPKDRSKQVFDAYTPSDKVLASITGEVNIGSTLLPSTEVTFEVIGVQATANATILQYQLTADEDTMLGVTGEHWNTQPSLRIPGTKVRTRTLTASLPRYNGGTSEICVCTAVSGAGTTPQPQEVAYPALPADVTEVDVILDELDPLTVPVTR